MLKIIRRWQARKDAKRLIREERAAEALARLYTAYGRDGRLLFERIARAANR